MSEPESGISMLSDSIHDLTVVMQAAWIEWRLGGGAETAMQWIENSLEGPGLIPDPNEPYADDAQLFYNLNRTHATPPCTICGKPTHIGGSGGYACSDEHYTEIKRAHDASAPEEQE